MGVTSNARDPTFDSLKKQSQGMSSIPSGSLSSGSSGFPTTPVFTSAVANALIASCMKTGTPTFTMPSMRSQRTNASFLDAAVVLCPPNRRSETTSPEPATHAPSVHW